MITISKDEKRVKVAIKTGLYQSSSEVWLYWNCESEMFAELLAKQLRTHIEQTVEAIRKQEYERGWKDKTKRRQKSTFFYDSLDKNLKY
jgi:hypothetical protein